MDTDSSKSSKSSNKDDVLEKIKDLINMEHVGGFHAYSDSGEWINPIDGIQYVGTFIDLSELERGEKDCVTVVKLIVSVDAVWNSEKYTGYETFSFVEEPECDDCEEREIKPSECCRCDTIKRRACDDYIAKHISVDELFYFSDKDIYKIKII